MLACKLKENIPSEFFNSSVLNQSCRLSLTAKWNGGEHCAPWHHAKLSDRSDRKSPNFARFHSFIRYDICAIRCCTLVQTEGKLTVLFRTEFRETLIHVSRADLAWQCIFRLLSSCVIEAPVYLKTRRNLSTFVFAAVTCWADSRGYWLLQAY